MSVSGISQSNYALQFWQSQQKQADGTWGSASRYASSGANTATTNAYANSNSSMVEQLSKSIKLAMDTLGLKAGDRITFSSLLEAREKMEQDFAEQVKADLLKLGVDESVEFTLVSDGQGGIKVIMDESTVNKSKTLDKSDTIQTMLEELDLEGVKFSLEADGKGGLTVKGDAEHKEAIEQYLEDHPEAKAALFKEIGLGENKAFTMEYAEDGSAKVSWEYSGKDDKAAIEKYFKDNPSMVKKFNEIQSLTNLEQARKSMALDKTTIRKRIQMESMVAWFAGQGMSVDQLMQYSGGQSYFAASGLNYTA